MNEINYKNFIKAVENAIDYLDLGEDLYNDGLKIDEKLEHTLCNYPSYDDPYHPAEESYYVYSINKECSFKDFKNIIVAIVESGKYGYEDFKEDFPFWELTKEDFEKLEDWSY